MYNTNLMPLRQNDKLLTSNILIMVGFSVKIEVFLDMDYH